jgi:calcium-dependent protein kinase
MTKSQSRIGQEILSNMVDYNPQKSIQDAVWVFMVSHFAAEEEKRKLTDIYQEIDRDQDGLLNKEEIVEAFKKFEINNSGQDDIEDIIKRIDRNDNGTIDYSEFVIAAINKKKLLDKKNLEATFKMIDKVT